MSKTSYSITRQLQDDLMKAYCEESGSSWTMQEACEKAVKHPAPRYYITPKQAFQVISPMMRGEFFYVETMTDNKRRMYYSLFQVVKDLSEKREFAGKSMWHIMKFAVMQPAPEFFMNWSTAYGIRLRIKQGYVQEDGKCVGMEARDRAYARMLAKREYRKRKEAELLCQK